MPGANLEDLDEEAILFARKNYKNKFPEKATEVESWDDATFLNKAKITIKGKITRTAIILLGKEESEHFINPAEAKIRWILKDANGNDKDYARLLARNKDLALEEIMMLDKVQKKKELTEFEEKYLKAKKLIEGRKPNYYIGIKVAQETGQKASYSKNKAFDKSYYLDLVEKAIREHACLERSDIDELLWNKLPEWMNEKQKKNKIGNLISELRMNGKIQNLGSFNKPSWSLKK